MRRCFGGEQEIVNLLLQPAGTAIVIGDLVDVDHLGLDAAGMRRQQQDAVADADRFRDGMRHEKHREFCLVPELKQPSTSLSIFALFGLILFLLGKFSATIARLENHRLLRPGASYMLLCAYLCAGVAIGIILVQMGLGSLPHRDMLRAIELMGKEVAPMVRKAIGEKT